jgi:HEPN domain-containing protein/predicted nucleotidyltransferase
MVRLAPTADPALEVIVSRLERVCRPELVLLFGSRAAGTARPDSDYDLLVIVSDGAPVEHHQRRAWEALRGASIAADVLVRTISEYRRAQHDPGLIDWLVARQGIVLFSSGSVAQRSPAGQVRESRTGVDLWRQRAAEDLEVAELAVRSGAVVPGAVCFHAHAAIEKFLKAEIAALGAYPPRTHDLLELLEALPPRFHDAAELRSACTQLQRTYPASRYPDRPLPAEEDATAALAAARVARDLIAP